MSPVRLPSSLGWEHSHLASFIAPVSGRLFDGGRGVMFEVGDVPAAGGDGDKKGDLGRTWTAKCPRLVWSVWVSRVVSSRVESSCAACQVRVQESASGEWRTRCGMRCGLSGQPGVYCGGHLLSFTLVLTVKFMSDWALNSENQ